MMSHHPMSDEQMNERFSPGRLAGRPFARMNGIGNAIVVLDLRGSDVLVAAEDVRAIAAVPALAFDQLMVVHDPSDRDPSDHDLNESGTDAHVRIYNNDGSPSGACGNGTRCVAWFLLRGTTRDTLRLTTEAGRLECRKLGDTRFSVDMGAPQFGWDRIPLRDGRSDPRALDLGHHTLGPAFAVGMGNPHAVFFVPDTDAIDLGTVGPLIEHAPIFPAGVNVSFAQIVDRTAIKLRVWERGAGATRACGTGACAVLVAAASTGRTERTAHVDLPGGRLEIAWRADGHVVMTGPVELEFEGTIDATLFADQAA